MKINAMVMINYFISYFLFLHFRISEFLISHFLISHSLFYHTQCCVWCVISAKIGMQKLEAEVHKIMTTTHKTVTTTQKMGASMKLDARAVI